MRRLLLLPLLLLGSCRSTGPDGATVSRAEVLRTARSYTSLTWQAEKRHALHGTAPDGQRIDTPDALHPHTTQRGFWWKLGSNTYLFQTTIVSPDTAWLFACGYYG